MNTRDPHFPDPPRPPDLAGSAAPAATGTRKTAAPGEHPFLPRPGYVGTLVAGPPKKPPRITHGRHPRGYRRPDDMILAEIRERLRERPDIEAAGVRVALARGIVRLSGEMKDEQQRRRVEDCIGNITGVVRIDNGIAVKG